MAGGLGAIGGALPLVGSGLGLVSKIGSGIAGLFTKDGTNQHAVRAKKFFDGLGGVGNMIGGGEGKLNEGAARARGLAQGAQNLTVVAKWLGRQFAGGMGQAIRNRDFGGALNQFTEGMGRFGQMGRGMFAEAGNMYDQGRDMYEFGRQIKKEGERNVQTGRASWYLQWI
jgi:hypothetical protein